MAVHVKVSGSQRGASALQEPNRAGSFGLTPDSPETRPLFKFSLAPAALLALIFAQPSLAAPVDATANYILTLGGLNIAQMKVVLKDDGQRYNMDLSANVAGLANVVMSGTAKASSTGRSDGQSLASSAFALETKAGGETFKIDVTFAGKNVDTFKVEPAIIDSYDRVPLERKHLTGVGDFLSSFVLKGKALDKNLCTRQNKIFTGVERFDIGMSYAGVDEATSQRTGYQGPVVLCTLDYNPISGHFSSSEMTNYLAESNRIILWYAPLGETGYYVPYRVLLGTNMGDLSMVLTSLTQ
jgi:hypothetical protein